jgi:hypothetical protein
MARGSREPRGVVPETVRSLRRRERTIDGRPHHRVARHHGAPALRAGSPAKVRKLGPARRRSGAHFTTFLTAIVRADLELMEEGDRECGGS